MTEREGAPRLAYKRYVLGALTLVYTLNFLDRGLIVLLLEPIKKDLNLSDSQLGFLTGIAFGLFYATLGVPMARWADRGNRVTVTSIAIGLWGCTVMLCVFVTNFLQLAFARVAAAVGEAGCMPPTYSLIGDYFPKAAERSQAMSIYMLAGPLSALLSFIVGGWLNTVYGWRMTFLIMGFPALLIALLVKLTVAEPRGKQLKHTQQEHKPLPVLQVVGNLWRLKSARHLSIGLILLYTMGMGLAPWYAAFMMRIHGMGTAELGLWLGIIFGGSGVVGTLMGGYTSSHWFATNEAGQMKLSAIVVALLVPSFALFLMLPEKHQALIALIPLVIVFNFFLGPTFALMQRLVAAEVRATSMAVVMLLCNIIGMGIGPQLVGITSDLLAPAFGSESLRYAMLMTSTVALWAAYHLWRVSHTVSMDIETVSSVPALEMDSTPVFARER